MLDVKGSTKNLRFDCFVLFMYNYFNLLREDVENPFQKLKSVINTGIVIHLRRNGRRMDSKSTSGNGVGVQVPSRA